MANKINHTGDTWPRERIGSYGEDLPLKGGDCWSYHPPVVQGPTAAQVA